MKENASRKPVKSFKSKPSSHVKKAKKCMMSKK